MPLIGMGLEASALERALWYDTHLVAPCVHIDHTARFICTGPKPQ